MKTSRLRSTCRLLAASVASAQALPAPVGASPGRVRSRGPRRHAAAARVFLLAGMTVLVTACRTNPWRKTEVLHSDSGVAIYREALYDESGEAVSVGYVHPVKVEQGSLGALLASLGYTQDRAVLGDRKGQLFSPDEVERLAGPLAAALARIGPDERVRFLVSSTSRYLIAGESLDGTSAVVFSNEPGRLEIAFDLIKERLSSVDYGDPRTARFYGRPTELRESAYRIVAPEIVTHHRDPEAQTAFPLWISVDEAAMASLAEAVRVSEAPGDTVSAATDRSAALPPPAPRGSRRVLVYEGCDVYRVGERFLALPPGAGPLDIEKFADGKYRLFFAGDTLREVTRGIDDAIEAGLLD